MADDALTSLARWHAVVKYRTDAGLLDVDMYLEEIGDIQDRIEFRTALGRRRGRRD